MFHWIQRSFVTYKSCHRFAKKRHLSHRFQAIGKPAGPTQKFMLTHGSGNRSLELLSVYTRDSAMRAKPASTQHCHFARISVQRTTKSRCHILRRTPSQPEKKGGAVGRDRFTQQKMASSYLRFQPPSQTFRMLTPDEPSLLEGDTPVSMGRVGLLRQH